VISGNLAQLSQGSNLTITGTVGNQNKHPIVHTTVYGKIFHKRGDGVAKDVNGPDVVDWVKLAEDLSIPAGATVPLSYAWKVPTNAEPGSYQIATFVIASGKFEMLGLSFTDDVVGGSFNFTVVGDGIGATRFDKAGVKVGEQTYRFAAFPPRVAKDTPTPVTAIVTNTTDSPVTTTVSWKVYSWDALSDDNLIDQASQEVTIAPKSSQTVSFTVKDTAHSVYYVVGEFSRGASKSIIGVRFVRAGINIPRISSAGATTYPATTDGKAYACVHNTGLGQAENSRIELYVQRTDLVGRLFGLTLGKQTYFGSIPGKMSAFSVPVTGSASTFIVNAKLYQNDALIDESSISYDCKALGAPCATDWASYIIGVLILAILALAYFVFRHYSTKK